MCMSLKRDVLCRNVDKTYANTLNVQSQVSWKTPVLGMYFHYVMKNVIVHLWRLNPLWVCSRHRILTSLLRGKHLSISMRRNSTQARSLTRNSLLFFFVFLHSDGFCVGGLLWGTQTRLEWADAGRRGGSCFQDFVHHSLIRFMSVVT